MISCPVIKLKKNYPAITFLIIPSAADPERVCR